MATFVISDLDTTKNFTFENIKFEKMSGDTELKRQWRDRFRATFLAEAEDNLTVTPIIREGGLVQVIHDLCVLLSLARSRSIMCPNYIFNGIETQRTSSPKGCLFDNKLIQDDNIESYLHTASQKLRQHGWAEKTSFIPSVYYLLERYHHEHGDVSFILTWVALEVMANTYAEKTKMSSILTSSNFKKVEKAVKKTLKDLNNQILPKEKRGLVIQKLPELNRSSTRTRIQGLRAQYGWDFITDSMLDECIKLRNYIMHSGNYGHLDRTTLGDLYFRMATTVQLALIDLLDGSGYVHNLQELKTRIKGA
jgi:hypothetical protein